MASPFVLDRLPQNDDELWWTVKALWGVTIPRTRVCPGHVAPFECFADAYFNRDGSITLWHGSRGLSGKSFMLSALGLTKAFLLGADTNLLGGSLAQSANVHEAMRAAMDSPNAPRYMVETESQQLIKLTNKARIRPLTASQKTVRGPHPPFLLLDEIDEMDENILNAALGQPMPQMNYLGQENKPYTVLCSTWQNSDGTFAHKKREFEEKGLPIKTWCYRESANPVDGWLSEETIANKKREIPAEMWRVEYELGEPSIGNRAFDSDAIESTFAAPMEPIKRQESKDYEEFTFAEYDRNGQYVAGADWAKEQDFTVISVIRVDKHPYTMVYWLRLKRRPYPIMIGMFNEAIQKYNAQAIHDSTGLGNVVGDYLDSRARGFTMTGEKRAAMLSRYVSAVERGDFLLPKIPTAYLAHKYARYGDLYENTKDYHLPDEVCALALANYHAHKNGLAVAPAEVPKTKEPNKYERVFESHAQESTYDVLGGVKIKTDDTDAISLLV